MITKELKTWQKLRERLRGLIHARRHDREMASLPSAPIAAVVPTAHLHPSSIVNFPRARVNRVQ